MTDEDPDRPVRYLLTWPKSLQEAVATAAARRTMSIATWMRQAALEKLERDRKEQR